MSLPIIRIRHLRHPASFPHSYLAPWEIRKRYRGFLPRGGITEVTLLDSDTREVIATGKAVCSDKENYCKKVGRDIAIGRAFKAWEKSLELEMKVIRWRGDDHIQRLRDADIAITTDDVVIKDRWGPTPRAATPKELAMVKGAV